MSNKISKIKREKKKHIETDIRKVMRNSVTGGKLNFLEKVLPNTLYIRVNTGEVRLGDNIKKLGLCPIIMMIDDDNKVPALIDYLDNHTDEQINKVIIEMGNEKGGFHIRKRTEVINDLMTRVMSKIDKNYVPNSGQVN